MVLVVLKIVEYKELPAIVLGLEEIIRAGALNKYCILPYAWAATELAASRFHCMHSGGT